MEFNLERRNKDFKAIVKEKDELQSDFDTSKNQLEKATERVTELEALTSAARSQLTSLFISLSQYLDVNCEREEEIKPVLYSTARQIFPSSLSRRGGLEERNGADAPEYSGQSEFAKVAFSRH